MSIQVMRSNTTPGGMIMGSQPNARASAVSSFSWDAV
jgi:hypothetical protein